MVAGGQTMTEEIKPKRRRGRPKFVPLSDDTIHKHVEKAKKMAPGKLARVVNGTKRQLQEAKEAGKQYTKVHIPIEVLIHFCRAGFTQSAMADILGVSPFVISRAFRKYKLDWNRLKTFKEVKSDVLALKQMQLLEKMTQEKMEEASLRDQATTLNILSNAEKVERGQATKIVDVRVLTDQLDELDQEEKRLREMLEMAEVAEPISDDKENNDE
jgi:transposase